MSIKEPDETSDAAYCILFDDGRDGDLHNGVCHPVRQGMHSLCLAVNREG